MYKVFVQHQLDILYSDWVSVFLKIHQCSKLQSQYQTLGSVVVMCDIADSHAIYVVFVVVLALSNAINWACANVWKRMHVEETTGRSSQGSKTSSPRIRRHLQNNTPPRGPSPVPSHTKSSALRSVWF